MVRPDINRNRHEPIAIGTRPDSILPRKEFNRLGILEHCPGIIMDFLEQFPFSGQDCEIGILRAIWVPRAKVGINLISGINQQRASG